MPCGSGTRTGTVDAKRHRINFRYGEDPENTTPMENDLQAIILEFWARNNIRPSNFHP